MVYGGGAEGVKVYVDKLRAELADDLWGDGNHLNHAGAKVFTKMLAGELERRSLL